MNFQITKNVCFIVLLLSTASALYAQYPKGSDIQFPVFSQGVEYLYSDENDTNKNAFTIRTDLSTEEIVIELTSEDSKLTGKYEIYNILGKKLLHGTITEKRTTIPIIGKVTRERVISK